MAKINKITLTGVDAMTSDYDLVRLSEIASEQGIELEWGLLFSPARAGQPGRYDTALNIARRLEAWPQLKFAIHFCGRAVRNLVHFEESEAFCLLEAAQLHERCRVQLNFNQAHVKFQPTEVTELLKAFPGMEFIVQFNENNAPLIAQLGQLAIKDHWAVEPLPELEGLRVLFDASGGKGLSPEKWPSPGQAHGFVAGYAGGLKAENIVAQAQAIEALNPGPNVWLDMENSLRVEDVLCPKQCEAVINNFAAYLHMP